jgi:hypothetical protein
MRASRLLAAAALLALVAGPAAAQKAPARLPDWSGLWEPEGTNTAISGLPETLTEARAEGKTAPSGGFNRPLFGFGAPWNEEGKRRQAARQGETANCRAQGWGFPMMMNADAPIQFFIAPGKVLIVNAYRDVTDVRMAKAHPPEDDLWPTVWGDTIGHWEGDTLVIDTSGYNDKSWLSLTGIPHTEKLHTVEHIRRLDFGHIEVEIVMEDSEAFTGPWKRTFTATLASVDEEIMEFICGENNRDPNHYRE